MHTMEFSSKRNFSWCLFMLLFIHSWIGISNATEHLINETVSAVQLGNEVNKVGGKNNNMLDSGSQGGVGVGIGGGGGGGGPNGGGGGGGGGGGYGWGWGSNGGGGGGGGGAGGGGGSGSGDSSGGSGSGFSGNIGHSSHNANGNSGHGTGNGRGRGRGSGSGNHSCNRHDKCHVGGKGGTQGRGCRGVSVNNNGCGKGRRYTNHKGKKHGHHSNPGEMPTVSMMP